MLLLQGWLKWTQMKSSNDGKLFKFKRWTTSFIKYFCIRFDKFQKLIKDQGLESSYLHTLINRMLNQANINTSSLH